MERGGKVVAEVAEKLTGRCILEFIKRAVKIEGSEHNPDAFHAYHAIGREMKHQIVNHQEQYVDGDVHTNTLEGFGLCESGQGMDRITITPPALHLFM